MLERESVCVCVSVCECKHARACVLYVCMHVCGYVCMGVLRYLFIYFIFCYLLGGGGSIG